MKRQRRYQNSKPSNELVNDRPTPISCKILAHLLSILLIIQPGLLAADGVTVDSTNTQTTTAANGVPVVNIATPSAAGVSHNTFTEYNVEQQGLILNNSASVIQSQLGGTVDANTNLQAGSEASLILNEITAPNRSQLNGYTEIAGQQANLIIANPYGITCNGCGFINTPDVTLTTATPELNNGQLHNLSVNQGDIAIEGLGLNATNIDQFSIITRATQINAELNTNSLNLILGRNDVDPDTKTPTAKATDGSTKPTFALDASALGGMYANQIKLIGTEAGVGVKVDSTMATDASDLFISADGNISLAQTQSANDLSITSTNGDITLNNTTYALNTIDVEANSVNNNDLTAAQNNITINASNLNQDGTLIAGLNSDYTLNNTGDLTLNINNTINNNGLTVAGNQLNITTDTLNNNDTLQSGGNTDIQATTINNNNAIAANDLNITADNLNNNTVNSLIKADNNINLQISNTLDNNSGSIDAANSYTINANNINNSNGSIESAGSDTNQITVTDTLNNTQGEIRSNSDTLTINTDSLNNQQGTLAHAGTQTSSVFTLNVNNIDNRAGFIGTKGRLNLTGFTAIDNSLLAGNTFISTIIADHLEINGGSINNNGGKLYATGTNSANINTTNLSNDGGDVFSIGNLNLNTQTLSNSSGMVQSSSNIVLDLLAWDINDINSVINASNHLIINLQGDLNHSTGNSLIANNDLTINTTGNIINSGEISTGNDFIFTGNNLTNNTGATLSAGNDFTLTIQGLIDNSGKLTAQNTLAITAGTLTNQSLIGAGDTLSITTLLSNITNNGGTLFSNNQLNIRTDSDVSNIANGNIFAVNNISIQGRNNARAFRISNTSSSIESLQGNIDIKGDYINNLRSGFLIDPETGLAPTTGTASSITAGGNITIDAIDFTNSVGSVAANGDITFNIDNRLQNIAVRYGDTLTDTHVQSLDGISSTNFYGATNTATGDNFDIANGAAFIADIQNKMNTGQYLNTVYLNKIESTVLVRGSHAAYPCEPAPLCFIANVHLYRITATGVERANNNISRINPAGRLEDIQDIADEPGYRFLLTDAQRNTLIASGFTSVNASTLSSTANEGDGYTFLDQNTLRNPQYIPSTIYAGQNLNTSNVGFINNSNGGGLAGSQGNIASPVNPNENTSANSQSITAASATLPIEDHIYNPAANLSLPNSGSLFTLNTDPDQNYLIETNPDLIDLGFYDPNDNDGTFVGSDDIYNLLPENPDVTTRRLGDAFYETRLIREAVLQATGQRYIDDSINDDAEQMRYLSNNAIAAHHALNLSVGVALSADQVAQLTHDIIWLEEQEVQGYTVLVPVYYASALRVGDLSQGALIMADNINLNLSDGIVNSGSIQAKQAVNIDAANDILNNDGKINAQQVNLTAGDSFSNLRGRITSTNNGNILLVARKGDINNTAGIIDAANKLELDAKNNIVMESGTIRSGGDTELKSGNNIDLSGTQTTTVTGSSRNGTTTTSVTQQTLEIGGSLTLDSANQINLSATDLNAGGDITLHADEVNLNALENRTETSTQQGRSRSNSRTVTHETSDLNASGNLTINTTGDLNTQGSQLISGGDATLNIEGKTNLLAVHDEDYSYSQETKKRSWGRKKTTTTEDLVITSQETSLEVGGNLLINAEVDSVGQITRLASDDINLEGTNINVDGEAIIYSDGNVNVFNALDFESHRHEVKKRGALGLSKSNKGSSVQEQYLNATDLSTRTGDISLLSDDSINIVASNVNSAGDINLEAFNDVNISAGIQTNEDSYWDISSRYLSGGDIMRSDELRDGSTHQEYIASSVFAQNDINIDAGSANVIGSDLIAGNNLNAKTDIGDINVIAAGSKQDSFTYAQHTSMSVTDMLDSMLDIEGNLEGMEDSGQLQINLGTVNYEESDSQTTQVTHRESSLQAKNNINLDSVGDINITGTTVLADADDNATGDINLKAQGNINIIEAEDSIKTLLEETVGTAELNFVVQNEYDQIVRVAEKLDDAKDNLKDARRAYKQYERDLKKQEANLAELEVAYANNEPGISFADIADLREIVSDAKDDKEWYQAGVVAAEVNVASTATQLVQQISTAAASTGTWGFNAGIQFDLDATKTTTETEQTSSLASILQAQNINMTTGNNGNLENSTTLIQGSHINAANELNITTGTLDVLASKDSYESQSNSEHGHITISQTVYGSASGPSVSGSYDRSRDRNRSTSYNNSTLNADHINFNTTGDANLQGANIRANESLQADIGGDLLVESQQNRSSGSSNSVGISGGFNLGGPNNANNGQSISTAGQNFGTNGDVTSVSGGVNASNDRYRTRETVLSSLTSGGTATINVNGHTQINGAVVATTDDEGNDLGNLDLTTETFAYENLRNTNTNNQQSVGISTSVGLSGANPNDPNQQNAQDATGNNNLRLNTTNIAYSNSSNTQLSNTLATVGQGNLTIRDEDNSHDTTRLNRDTSETQRDLIDIDRQQGNIDMTVDTRLLTEAGREEIKEDFVDSYEHGQDIGRAVSNVANDENLGALDFFKNFQNNAQITQLKNTLARNPNHAHILEGLQDTEGSETYVNAFASLSRLAQEEFGLDIQDTNLYDATETTSTSLGDNLFLDRQGGIVADESHSEYGTIFIDANSDKENQVNTLGHEIAETRTLQNGGANDVRQESLANAFGTQFSSRVNQAAGGSLNSTGGTNFTENLLLTQSVFEGTARANTVGNARVNNRQLFTQEAAKLDQARRIIATDTRLSTQERQTALLQLDAVACSAVNCSASIPDADTGKAEFEKLEAYGEQLNAQNITIEAVLDNLDIDTQYTSGNGRSAITREGFTYTEGQAAMDAISQNHGPILNAAGDVIEGVGNGVMTGTLAVGTTTLAGVCGTGAGALACAGVPAGGVLTYEALGATQDSFQALGQPYTDQISTQVGDSFSADTHQGNGTVIDDLLQDITLAGGEVLLGRVIGQAAADRVSDQVRSVDATPSVTNTQVADTVRGDGRFWVDDAEVQGGGYWAHPIPEGEGVRIRPGLENRSAEEFNRIGQLTDTEVNIYTDLARKYDCDIAVCGSFAEIPRGLDNRADPELWPYIENWRVDKPYSKGDGRDIDAWVDKDKVTRRKREAIKTELETTFPSSDVDLEYIKYYSTIEELGRRTGYILFRQDGKIDRELPPWAKPEFATDPNKPRKD